MISLWVFTEPFRLALGWTGNLRENTPNLFIFIVLTFVPQMPAQAFLATFQKNITPFDRALNTFSLAFLVVGFISGIFAFMRLLRSQAQKFYLEEYEMRKMEKQVQLANSS